MVTYDLMLERQRLLGAEKFSIAANANETISLRFNFDKSWRRFDSKAAVFKNQKGEFYIIEILQNRAKVPWEVLTDVGGFELSLIGYESTHVLSSDKVEITVSESLLPEDCRTFSPSEVLFDRFRRECTAAAFVEYEDEIEALKRTHAKEKIALGEQIVEANEAAEAAIAAKNEEIEAVRNEYSTRIRNLNIQINELTANLNYANSKAEKWDMVDYALGLKTFASSALWAGGSGEYSLPMLNTASVTSFSASNFSTGLKTIGLDASSAAALSGVFLNHPSLQTISINNTDNIESFENCFDGCRKLRSITLGKLDSCKNIKRFACGADSLERVEFQGTLEAIDMSKAFDGCLSLQIIDGLISFDRASSISSMFNDCLNLETVYFKENSLSMNMDLSKCKKLSKESMLNIANSLVVGYPGNLIASDYAFQNNFPAGQERKDFISLVRDTKGWVLNLD